MVKQRPLMYLKNAKKLLKYCVVNEPVQKVQSDHVNSKPSGQYKGYFELKRARHRLRENHYSKFFF